MGSPRALASLVASALVLHLSVVTPRIAIAEPKSTDANLKKAGDLVRGAITKSQAGDHQAAIDLYLNAFLLVPNPALLSNIGSEFQQSNKPVEALKYFCKYLDADPNGPNAPYANAQAKALQIQLSGSADEETVCKPPVKPTPPIEKPTPREDLGTGPGRGGSTGSGSQVTAPPIIAAPPEPPRAGGGLKITGIVATAVGAVVLGLGIKYGLDAKAHSDFENNFKASNPPGTPWPSDIREYEKEGRDLNTKQAIFMTAGGVAIVGGIVIYLVGRSKSSSGERVSLRPAASLTSIGLALTGGF